MNCFIKVRKNGSNQQNQGYFFVFFLWRERSPTTKYQKIAGIDIQRCKG